MTGFAEAFSAVLESSLGVNELKAWPVGGVKLSQRLYQNAQQVSAITQTIIDQHMKGLHSARELRKALYEGYDFQKDPLDILQPLPKYLQVEFDKFKAAQLKTPALRAAYLEAIRRAEAGAGREAIEKKLRIAFYERNRYFANRIARTELHRAYTDQQARELMDQDRIEYVQIRLSSKHPKTDIRDYHAKVDLYGLGPGVYPKAEAPKPPFHPHCYCLLSPRIDLINPKPRFNPKAERAFLQSLPAKEARDVAGSWEKRRRLLEDGETMEGIYNQGKDALYRWKRVGEVGQDRRMENDLRNLVSGETYEAARATLQERTLPPDIVNAGLTEAEQVALHLWTRDTGKEAWFQQINQALRRGNEDDLQRLQPLIDAIRSGLEKLPPFVGVVYRAVKEKPFATGEFSRYTDRHQPGLEIVDAGFSGASQTLEQALRGRVKMIIESTDGKDISALSSKPEQQEILFTSGSRFLVTDRFDQTNKVIRLWLQQQPN